jgi:ABC-type antimicrobial peptide transport system permease subunit
MDRLLKIEEASGFGTNIRRREFALVRSLGMEDFTFTAMLLLEQLLSLMFALALSIVIIVLFMVCFILFPVPPIGNIGKYGSILSIDGHGVFLPSISSIAFWFGLFSGSVLIACILPVLSVRKNSIMSMWRTE